MKVLLLVVSFFIVLNSSAQNYSLNFNGTSQYGNLGAPIPANSSYTKSAWVYSTSNLSNRNILSGNNSPFWINAGILSAGQAGSYSLVTDPATFPLNTWTFVAVTYDAGTSTMNLYKNAILIATATGVGAFTSETIYLAALAPATSMFAGSIDEVQIWDHALSAAELKRNCYKAPAHNATGLLAYYDCNTMSTSTLLNLCTNGSPVNGILSGSPSRPDSPIQYGPNALKLDGTNDFAVIQNTVSGDFTIEFWMNTTMTGSGSAGSQWYGGKGIVDAEVGGVTNDWGFSLTGDRVAFGTGNPDVTINSTMAVNTGAWVHVAGTWNTSGQMNLYINGVLDASSTAGTALRTAPPRITIGEIQTNISFFNGAIDELRIWSGVRTATEIQTYMDQEIVPVSAPNLQTYFTFNQGITSGTNSGIQTLIDAKGNNNATLNNFSMTGSTSNFIAQNSSMVTLPVDWLSFTATDIAGSVQLDWSTAREHNTSRFQLERSINGNIWLTIGNLLAKGTSEGPNSYQFVDQQPLTGKSYYRIRQEDLDGKYSYSKTVAITRMERNVAFSILQNPARQNQLQFSLTSSRLMRLLAADGSLIRQERLAAGTYSWTVQTAGIYILTDTEKSIRIWVQ